MSYRDTGNLDKRRPHRGERVSRMMEGGYTACALPGFKTALKSPGDLNCLKLSIWTTHDTSSSHLITLNVHMTYLIWQLRASTYYTSNRAGDVGIE